MDNQDNKVDEEYKSFKSSNDDQDSPDKDDINILIERVDDLEDTINQITQQQGDISHNLRKQSKRIDKLEDNFSDIQEEIDDINKTTNINEGKVNSINSSLDKIEEKLEDTNSQLHNETKDLKKRIEVLEEVLELDKKDIAAAIKPDSCKLEQYATLPESTRNNEFPVRVQRAIALYDNFHEISSPVKSGGRRVLSKDIKTFLNGYSNTNIKYTQVQRVIDSFDENSNDNYKIVKTSEGRAILWKPNN